MSTNSFGARDSLIVGDRQYEIFRLDALQASHAVARLPFSLKILLENLLRNEDGRAVRARDIEALASWVAGAEPSEEIAFTPARVLMQDFTGVPAVVDLAAMRDAMAAQGGNPSRINPLVPAELVIDHSVQVDAFGTRGAFARNAELEFARNRERYAFLRWGQGAFDGFAVVPPDTGIVHQVNIEYLARVVFTREASAGVTQAYPDTLVGTDSHTTMVNGLGVLGWGVGGIEAEAAMLGQAMPMLIPQVVGFRLHGALPEGSTATDLVLTVTERLRQRGVVGKFVEFFGAGLAGLPLADRATIGNMSPEFGSTCAIFPIDAETLRYLELTGRPRDQIALVEAYARAQGLFHDERSEEPTYSETIELDLSEVEPSIAGPRRPQDRVPLRDSRARFRTALAELLPTATVSGGGARSAGGAAGAQPPGAADGQDAVDEASAQSFPASDPPAAGDPVNGDGARAREARVHGQATAAAGHGAPTAGEPVASAAGAAAAGAGPAVAKGGGSAVALELADGTRTKLDHGHVVIAAITSCTNTSNPSVMLGAGLLAKKAVQRGLERKPWVKTSLAPGSKVVTDYLRRAELIEPLEALGFHLVGYGCTTCIGNSGPLPPEVSAAVDEGGLAVAAVLSGNRNFEGRINPDVRMNYLASPPLVVAYALAGTMDIDLLADPLGKDADGEPVYLRDIWPDSDEVSAAVAEAVRAEMFQASYSEVFAGDENWAALAVPTGERFAWDSASTYVRQPPYFEDMPADPAPLHDICDARALVVLGDSVTTDHISPAGSIKPDSPAGAYLLAHDVQRGDFNSYGARRGNHEVMVRGTFANIRLRNRLGGEDQPLPEGGYTLHLPDGEQMTIYDAAMRYRQEGVPLVVLAGKEYGSGSSRDWAAKGTSLLGVRAVLAESFERIHRSNLIGMGVLPLQFQAGESVASLGLSGREVFQIEGLEGVDQLPRETQVRADERTFTMRVRIDTPTEAEYFRHGGILQYVLRGLLE